MSASSPRARERERGHRVRLRAGKAKQSPAAFQARPELTLGMRSEAGFDLRVGMAGSYTVLGKPRLILRLCSS